MDSYTWKNQQWHHLKAHDFPHKKDIWKTFEAFNDEIEEEPPHSQFNMSIAKKQTNTLPPNLCFFSKLKVSKGHSDCIDKNSTQVKIVNCV